MPSVETAEARPSPPESDLAFEAALTDAERFGRLEAEALDADLRRVELRERESLLGRTELSVVGFGSPTQEEPTVTNTEVLRLRRENDRLVEFHRALLHSRSWRLLQALRRPFGRAW